MALTVGTNSWITITEADEYLQHDMSAGEWFELVTTGKKGSNTKENVLVTAFKEISASPLVDIPKDSTDVNVKYAQAEMALYLLKFYDEIYSRRASIASGLSSFKYSEREERFDTSEGGGSTTLPSNVLGLLNEYVQSNTTVELTV